LWRRRCCWRRGHRRRRRRRCGRDRWSDRRRRRGRRSRRGARREAVRQAPPFVRRRYQERRSCPVRETAHREAASGDEKGAEDQTPAPRLMDVLVAVFFAAWASVSLVGLLPKAAAFLRQHDFFGLV